MLKCDGDLVNPFFVFPKISAVRQIEGGMTTYLRDNIPPVCVSCVCVCAYLYVYLSDQVESRRG